MFLKIDDVYLNPAHIVSIEDDCTDLYVFTVRSSAYPTENKPYYLIPDEGGKATALRAWLGRNAEDLLNPEEPDYEGALERHLRTWHVDRLQSLVEDAAPELRAALQRVLDNERRVLNVPDLENAGGVEYHINLEYGGVQGGHYTGAPYICEDCGDDGIVYHPVKK